MAVAAKRAGKPVPQATAKHRKPPEPRRKLPEPRPKAPELPRQDQARTMLVAPEPVLPDPPLDSEKYGYVRRHTWVLTVFSMLSFPPLVYSQVELVRRYPSFLPYAPFIICGILLFGVPLITDGFSRGFDLAAHRRVVETWHPASYPTVDVFLPVCGEPIEILRNTWRHVARLRQRYRGPLTVWVLDDSASPELKELAREFGYAYATRPNRGWFKKSGNLMYGYLISESEYILLLDADFCPRADLLDETLPYLDQNPQVAIVQTPQFFHVTDDQTWVERGAGAVQELFYRSIQTARASRGGATCVGSCAVYRRSALDTNNGMALSEHSEDLRTGFDLQRRGWRLKYLPIALSTGTCPDNVLAFLNQQYRWCSGTITLLGEKLFWRTRMTAYSRMCHLSGFIYYLYTAIFTIVVPALSCAVLIFAPSVLQFKNIIFILPILIYGGIIYPLWHRSPYRLEAWSVRVIAGWAHLFAFWDLSIGHRRGWQPSGAAATKQDGRRRFWLAVLLWSGGSTAAWVCLAFWRLLSMDPYNMVMIFVLGLFEFIVVSRILIQPRVGAAA